MEAETQKYQAQELKQLLLLPVKQASVNLQYAHEEASGSCLYRMLSRFRPGLLHVIFIVAYLTVPTG